MPDRLAYDGGFRPTTVAVTPGDLRSHCARLLHSVLPDNLMPTPQSDALVAADLNGLKAISNWGSRVNAATMAINMARPVNTPK